MTFVCIISRIFRWINHRIVASTEQPVVIFSGRYSKMWIWIRLTRMIVWLLKYRKHLRKIKKTRRPRLMISRKLHFKKVFLKVNGSVLNPGRKERIRSSTVLTRSWDNWKIFGRKSIRRLKKKWLSWHCRLPEKLCVTRLKPLRKPLLVLPGKL